MTSARIASFFCAAFCIASPAYANDCTSLATVSTEALPDGRIRVPMTLDGRPLTMLVDTGGVSTTIKGDLARQMGLAVKQTARTLAGVGGSRMNLAVDGEDFSVGALRVAKKPIYVESRPLPAADGTLAADILRNYDVEIDMAENRMSLALSGACAAPAWTASAVLPIEVGQSGHVRFPVRIDGVTIMATLDTGAATSVMSQSTAAALGVRQTSPGLELTHDAGSFQLYTFPFQALELGGVTVHKPNIAIASDDFLPGLKNELVLGIDALSRMRFTIAYAKNRLYIGGAQFD